MPAAPSPIEIRSSMPRRHPTVIDVFLGVTLVFVGLPEALLGSGRQPAALALDLALGPLLIWRRRSPLTSFWGIVAVTFGQWLIGPNDRFHPWTGYHLVADIALLVAFYTVAAQEPRRRTIAAAAVLEVALLLATVHWANGRSGPALFVLLSGTAAAAGVSGNNARTRRAYLAAVEQRAARSRSSAINRPGWPRRRSGRGSPARCTMSSPTTSR
jgi:hypothetical protein